MATSIGQMSAPLAAAFQAAEAVAIFHTIIDFPKPVYGSLTSDVSLDGDIALENVNFAYPARPEVKVLDNLNLRFPPGKITAIVGPSGSGKSTIVSIIERWYEFNGDPVTNPFVSAKDHLIVFHNNAFQNHKEGFSVTITFYLTMPRFSGAETDWSQSREPSSQILIPNGGVARLGWYSKRISYLILPSTRMSSLDSSVLHGSTRMRK